MEITLNHIWWARRVEDILAGFGDLSKKPADLGSSPSESVAPCPGDDKSDVTIM